MFKIIYINISKKFALTIDGSYKKKWLKSPRVGFVQKFPTTSELEVAVTFIND